MLYLRDFKGTERYKKTGYFIFTDSEGNLIGRDDKFLSEITPILLWEDMKDGGAYIKLAIYNEIPKGYKLFKDAPQAPWGYEWIYNGKARTNGRSIGLFKLKIDEDPKYPNLSSCEDYKCLLDYLADKSLSEIENVLEAHKLGKIQLVIPRNKNGEVEWFDDWDTTIIDTTYELTGSETLILKWYEGFEDTGYLIECFLLKNKEEL